MRVAYVLGLPVAMAIVWRVIMEIVDAPPWQTWIFSDHAADGPYVVALRSMFGFEDGIYLRQNLANAFIVNWLWLPTILAIATLVLIVRRPGACGAAAPGGDPRRPGRDLHVDDADVPDLHRAALRDGA